MTQPDGLCPLMDGNEWRSGNQDPRPYAPQNTCHREPLTRSPDDQKSPACVNEPARPSGMIQDTDRSEAVSSRTQPAEPHSDSTVSPARDREIGTGIKGEEEARVFLEKKKKNSISAKEAPPLA